MPREIGETLADPDDASFRLFASLWSGVQS